jgi:hypothetical protein
MMAAWRNSGSGPPIGTTVSAKPCVNAWVTFQEWNWDLKTFLSRSAEIARLDLGELWVLPKHDKIQSQSIEYNAMAALWIDTTGNPTGEFSKWWGANIVRTPSQHRGKGETWLCLGNVRGAKEKAAAIEANRVTLHDTLRQKHEAESDGKRLFKACTNVANLNDLDSDSQLIGPDQGMRTRFI